MAEDNSDQNIAQPQDGTQQTAPQTPSENVADEAQTSVTEPIAVPNAGEQPTTALPTVDAADGTAGNTADDTPDYASAAGERTVINNATQDAPTEQYRPRPNTRVRSGADAAGWRCQRPDRPATAVRRAAAGPAAGQPSVVLRRFRQPVYDRQSAEQWQSVRQSVWRLVRAERRAAEQSAAAAVRREHAPAGPGNRNPFGAPGQGFPNQPNQTPVVTKQKSGMTSHVVTAVVAALVSGALCLASASPRSPTVGCMCRPPARCPTSSPTRPVPVPPSEVRYGGRLDAVAKEVSDSVVAIDVATSDGEAKGSGVVISDKAISPPITT